MGNTPNIPDEAGIAAPPQQQQVMPAINPPTYTHVMIAPDGSIADVPADRVNDAVTAGARLGFEMVGPDGTQAVVPVDQAHAALTAGARPKGAVATGNAMQTSSAPGQVRTATSLLPAAGATAGGIAGAPGVVTGAVGAGLGAGIGSESEQVLNHYLLGDEVPSTVGGEFKHVGKATAIGAATDLGAQGLAAGVKGASNAYNLLRPGADVESQITKDTLKHVLGGKADADMVNNAAARIGKTQMFSTVENELKLVKPQLDAELTTQNAQLDTLLKNSKVTVPDSAHQVSQVFDDMIAQAKNGVGTNKDAMVKSINEVRQEVIGKLSNDPTGVKDLNDVKRLIGDEVKKFAPPEMLNSSQKAEQEAYRQSYFKLRDMVSQAEPDTAKLNQQISRNIDLQGQLERRFPHLENEASAKTSYQGVRKANALKAAKETAKTVTGAAITGEVFENAKNIKELMKDQNKP
jgi:hypothetical protein